MTDTRMHDVPAAGDGEGRQGAGRGRRLRWLAWVSLAIAVTTSAASLALLAMNADTPVPDTWGPHGFSVVFALILASVGVLIVLRHPQNAVGWLFCWCGAGAGLVALIGEYAIYALLAAPGSLPGGVVMAWLLHWLWVLAIQPLIVFVPLYFPNGRLPSPRWRVAVWAGVASLLALALLFAITPGPMDDSLGVVNPVGVEGLAPLLDLGFSVAALVTLGVIIAGAAAVVLRLRRSTGVEREQLKWFVYAVGLLVLVVPGSASNNRGLQLLVIVTMLGIPAAVGIAILRYRLYDIDILINRTLVYGGLTGTLGLVYFGSVVLLQELFRGILGQGDDLAIIISTLALAALFNPLRRRIQAFIDWRFFRRKYDAEQVLSAFASTLRNEVDLDRLTDALVNVVDDTMQPAHVSLWMRKVPRGTEGQRLRMPGE